MKDLQPEQVSQIVSAIFAEKGISTPWRETILLRNRYYVGRKFQAESLQVIWWQEKNLLEVRTIEGQLEQNIDLKESLVKAA
jgi:hypothetical protein